MTYSDDDFTEIIGVELLKNNLTKNYMQGYKTWAGILLTALGALGWGDLISSTQVADLTNLVTEVLGILLSIYGNYKAHREIKALGGYR